MRNRRLLPIAIGRSRPTKRFKIMDLDRASRDFAAPNRQHVVGPIERQTVVGAARITAEENADQKPSMGEFGHRVSPSNAIRSDRRQSQYRMISRSSPPNNPRSIEIETSLSRSHEIETFSDSIRSANAPFVRPKSRVKTRLINNIYISK